MSKGDDRIAAAADLLKRRVSERGGPPEVRARELAVELSGWVTEREMLRAYAPDVAPSRWVGGDHDRRVDYYDPAELAGVAGSVDAGATECALEVEREAICRVLRQLESGGGLLKRSVRWCVVSHTLQPGEECEDRLGPGQVRVDGVLVGEWLTGAVVIVRGGVVAKVYAEARLKCVLQKGTGGSRRPVARLQVPRLEAGKLECSRISMNVAVLLLRLNSIEEALSTGEAIAKAVPTPDGKGVTRANVSARRVRQEAEMEKGEFRIVNGKKDGRVA